MIFSWLIFGALSVCAAVFSAWIYYRRELPIPGRRALAVARGLILALVLLLLWDPRLPDSRAGAFGGGDRWVLLDGSASMEAGGDTSAWAVARERARQLAAGGARVLLFGGSPRVVPGDAISALVPTEGTSRLSPALARVAEAGAVGVTILSDLRLDDPVEASMIAQSRFLDIQIENGVRSVRNVGVARFELPGRVESEDTLVADVAVFAEGAVPGDTIRLQLFEEDRLVVSMSLLPPAVGRLTTASISLPAPRASGWIRYRLTVALGGDEFSGDDVKATFVEVDPEDGGLVLVSLQPDWEPRFLLPVLSQVTGLDPRGFLAMGGGRYLRLGQGAEAGRSWDESDVRRAASGADLLVLHGVGRSPPQWIAEVMAETPRALVFPADQGGAAVAGVRAGLALPGEWYPVPDLVPSPLAASMAGADLTGLPPLTTVLPRIGPDVETGPLQLQLQGRGASEAALVLREEQGRRRAVMLASGFWRWAFREGPERQVYRRLWAGVVGWLLASTPVEAGVGVRPAPRVVSVWDELTWRAPGMVGDSIELTLVAGDSVVLDTTVVVDAAGEARTRRLPADEYAYTARRAGGGDAVGSGRVEFERHSLELLRQPSDLASQTADSEGAPARGRRPGRPLRTSPLPYLLIMALLSAEWIARRRWGLR